MFEVIWGLGVFLLKGVERFFVGLANKLLPDKV